MKDDLLMTAPNEPQNGARPESAAMRFLRWLIEPPVGDQPAGSRVLRSLLRAGAFVVYAMVAGDANGNGNAGVARKDGKPTEPR